MARSHNTGRQVSLPARAALLIWLGFFVFLSADVLVRIIGISGRMPTRFDAATLIAIESCRTLTLLLAALLVGATFRSGGSRRVAGLYATVVAFVAVWYAQTFAFEAYPGHAQEWIARRLIGAGVPLPMLDLAFGSPEWSLWIALGAMLRLSVTWPRPIDPAAIAGSGARDRRGMMRSVALAGVDIGAAFRRLTARAVSRGAFEAHNVWPAVLIAGLVHTIVGSPLVRVLLVVALTIGAGVGITNLRASFAGATRRQRARIGWVVTAVVIAGSGFLVASALSMASDRVSGLVGIAFASLAPILVLTALFPVVRRTPPNAVPWLRSALLAGTSSVTGALAYLLSLTALPGAESPEIPVREFVAFVTSVVLVVLSVPRLRQLAVRITPPIAG